MTATDSLHEGRLEGRLMEPLPATKPPGTAPRGFGTTMRLDAWSLRPLAVILGLSGFGIYALVSAFLLTPYFGFEYEAEGYRSPFFSIVLGEGILPAWLSPAILVLWIQLGFRATCYYFRGAYYKAVFGDPPACAVGEPSIRRRYGMENRFPFVLQNLHRYFLYLALIPLAILVVDLAISLRHGGEWRVGLGTLLLGADALLLGAYVFSCHSMRHLIGGRLDCFSCSAGRRTRHGIWKRVSALNRNHGLWGWASLGSVIVADLYVRLLALGVLSDPAIRL